MILYNSKGLFIIRGSVRLVRLVGLSLCSLDLTSVGLGWRA